MARQAPGTRSRTISSSAGVASIPDTVAPRPGGQQHRESAAAADVEQPGAGAHFGRVQDRLIERRAHRLVVVRPITRSRAPELSLFFACSHDLSLSCPGRTGSGGCGFLSGPAALAYRWLARWPGASVATRIRPRICGRQAVLWPNAYRPDVPVCWVRTRICVRIGRYGRRCGFGCHGWLTWLRSIMIWWRTCRAPCSSAAMRSPGGCGPRSGRPRPARAGWCSSRARRGSASPGWPAS